MIMCRKYLILGLISLLAFTSCNKYLDINENPSFPQLTSAELLLAPIIFQMANGYSQDQRMTNKFSQAILGSSTAAASLNWDRHGYVDQSDVGGVMWRMVYFDHGHNLQLLLDDAIKNKKYEYAGIGYAIKAWGYQMLTDYHGPVILDEALRPSQLKFKYEDQDKVYAKVREWCDSSLYYFSLQSPINQIPSLSSEKTDNLYRGNIARWKKFVYGLKATQFNHLVNKSDYLTSYADSVIRYVDLSFESSSDDAAVMFKGESSTNSSVVGSAYGVYTSTSFNRAGWPIVKYLTGGLRGTGQDAAKTSLDPRLKLMLNFTGPDSIYIGGMPNVANTTVPAITGRVINNVPEGKFIFRDKASFPIMTYAQLQLIKAEAQFLKGDKNGAYTSYINAIIGHMAFVNTYADIATGQDKVITTAEITAYLNTSGEIPTSGADLTLADIMGQKYIVQWGWGGMEQWCDLRKYKYNPAIFRQFIPLSGTQLMYNDYCYRVRPRYNSEYVWNEGELMKWGALEPEYVTKPTWFVLPN